MNRKRLSMESLETRETPAVLAGTDLVAASLSAVPAIDYTGPLGGTVKGSHSLNGNTITQELIYVGPQGNTVFTETATVTVNPRTGVVSGTVTVVGLNGRTSTGTITGVVSGNTFTENTVLTGPNGQTITQHGVYVGNDSSINSTASWTGPNGNSMTRSGMLSYDATDVTIHIAGTLTGPNGKSLDYGRTLGSRL